MSLKLFYFDFWDIWIFKSVKDNARITQKNVKHWNGRFPPLSPPFSSSSGIKVIIWRHHVNEHLFLCIMTILINVRCSKTIENNNDSCSHCQGKASPEKTLKLPNLYVMSNQMLSKTLFPVSIQCELDKKMRNLILLVEK